MSDVSSGYPLLVFGEPARAEREKLTSGRTGAPSRRPSASEQHARLGSKWSALENTLAAGRAAISATVGGVDPELVLVIEVVGSVGEFVNAVRQIEGFEYLAEIDEEGIVDEAFIDDGAAETESLDGSLYLLATNQAALSAVLRLWQQYRDDETASFPYGLGRWKQVFQLLVDVRRWGPNDRLRGTGAVEDFLARVAAGEEVVPTEIELWFRSEPERRRLSEDAVAQAVAALGGQVLARAAIAPIAYHALLVTIPVSSIQPILEGRPEEVALIRADEIAFLRPEAQALVNLEPAADVVGFDHAGNPAPSDEEPLVAILDGLPLAAHTALDGRLAIDDPDNWTPQIAAAQRQHGTAVASLVVRGDAATASAATPARRVYLRPVLMPEHSIAGIRECVPHDQLAVDLIYRAVLRMKDDSSGPPAAPEVRVVNLSIGDAASPLATTLSPWARLLDYLAWRFDLLFVVSAGNYRRPITYPYSSAEFDALTPESLRRETLRLLVADAANRRILSPAEAVSCICVGSAHDDGSGNWVTGARRDVLPGSESGAEALPSPISAAGMGYRRAIKPDMLAPGGRILFRRQPGAHSSPTTTLDPAPSDIAPGLRVAAPSGVAGVLNGHRYFQGTSGAAALVSHHAALMLEHLAALVDDSGNSVDSSAWAVLVKALLVHSCALPKSASELRGVLGDLSPNHLKDAVNRFYGYGVIDPSRVLSGNSRRATAIGWGELADGEAARFEFPLPPSLSGQVVKRRLILTVAYFPPIRPRDRRHRAAEIYMKPEGGTLRVTRQDADWRTVKRGSVQHEVLAGDAAAAYLDGTAIVVQVNCRALVQSMKDTVPFGLAVTLEADADIPVHAEVAARIRSRAQARVRG